MREACGVRAERSESSDDLGRIACGAIPGRRTGREGERGGDV